MMNEQYLYEKAKELKTWRETAVQEDPKIFFLKDDTDLAAKAFTKVQDKIKKCSRKLTFCIDKRKMMVYIVDVQSCEQKIDKVMNNDNGGCYDDRIRNVPIQIRTMAQNHYSQRMGKCKVLCRGEKDVNT